MKSDKLLPVVREAGEVIGAGRSTMYELLRSGRVESVRIGPASVCRTRRWWRTSSGRVRRRPDTRAVYRAGQVGDQSAGD